MVEPKEIKREKEKEREKTPVFFRADAHGKMYRRRFIKRREGFCTDFAPLPPRTSPPTELIIGFLVFSDPRFFFVLDRGRESFDRGPRLTRPI